MLANFLRIEQPYWLVSLGYLMQHTFYLTNKFLNFEKVSRAYAITQSHKHLQITWKGHGAFMSSPMDSTAEIDDQIWQTS